MVIIENLRNIKTTRIPVWFMRQAGRYLPEYQEIRKKAGDFFSMCYNPKLASEVTLQPIRRFDLDAAIIFADILVVPHALGINIEFNKGPVVEQVFNDSNRFNAILKNLNNFHLSEKVAAILETIALTKSRLPESVALIGFAGSPFTVATYIIEGGSSRDFSYVKKAIIINKERFNTLINILTDATIIYLKEQIKAGAQIIKLFDSWASVLYGDNYLEYIIKPTNKIISAIREDYPNVPIICFPRGSGLNYLDFGKSVDCNALALDEAVPLDFILSKLQNIPNKVLQGNFSNYTLAYGNIDQIAIEAKKVITTFNTKPFIFNLGHGILPETKIENVEALMGEIRSWS